MIDLPAGPPLDPGLLWLAAMLTAVAYVVLTARRSGLDPVGAYWTAVAAAAGGVWGSHLLGIRVYGADGDPLYWLRVWDGAKSWYGGLIGGTVAALVALRAARKPVLRHADLLAPAVALGYAIGRAGCFLHGDDYGTLASIPWAVRYGPGTEAFFAHVQRGLIAPSALLTLPIHPVQLYHCALGLLLFAFLSGMPPTVPGRKLALLGLAYGGGRFCLEGFRGDFAPGPLGLSLQQWISFALIAAGALFLHRLRKTAAPRVLEQPS
ncbi:MAG TPA: prolipoprotein diacylglyceryl transferase family protein [Myxococcales bacterium]